MRRPMVALPAVRAALVGPGVPASAGPGSHSGTIAEIADDARAFVLAEVGPWQVRDGATVLTRRIIALTPDTASVIAVRTEVAPSGFPDDFVEVPVGPDRVYLGDYVSMGQPARSVMGRAR